MVISAIPLKTHLSYTLSLSRLLQQAPELRQAQRHLLRQLPLQLLQQLLPQLLLPQHQLQLPKRQRKQKNQI